MKRTYVGSCHCSAVRFEVDIDLSAGTEKCNCSICTKMRAWGAMVKPENFRLLAGEADLTDYQFSPNSIHHVFCRRCGVRSFEWGNLPELGGKYYAINVTCLDDVNIDEVVNAPIAYFDGRNNNWQSSPAEIRHL